MSPQKKAIMLILDFIEDKLGYTIETTGLPVGGGISAEVQAAKDNGATLNRQRQDRTLPLLLLSKTRHKVQQWNSFSISAILYQEQTNCHRTNAFS